MHRSSAACAAAIVTSATLGACSLPMVELLRDVVPANGNPTSVPPKGIVTCGATSATQAKLIARTSSIRANTFAISNALDVSAVNQRLQNLPKLLHADLREQPVVQEILRAIGKSISATHANTVRMTNQIDSQLHPGRRVTASTLLSRFEPSDDSSAALGQPRDLTMGDFLSLITALRHALVESAAPSEADASPQAKQFAQAFVYYFKTFINGKFYTRFGRLVSGPPALISVNGSTAVISISNTSGSVTVTDAEIAGTVQVFLELVLDYALQTPVWSDGAKTPTYYPGKGTGNTTPTVVQAHSQGFMPLTIDNLATKTTDCGIDPLRAEAVQYIATMIGTNAAGLGGAVGGSFGGINVGLGVLGKISIGDNKTIHDVVTTALQTVFTRIGEEASWRVLYWIGYPNTTPTEQEIVNLIQQYLAAQLGTAGT